VIDPNEPAAVAEQSTGDAPAAVQAEPAQPESAPSHAALELAASTLREVSTEVRTQLKALEARLAAVEAAVGELGKQIGFVPQQVRMLAGKLDGLGTSISEPRYRALLLDLVMLHDLVHQMASAHANGQDQVAELERHREVLLRQIRQVLATNGLSEIQANGPFDPAIHRAVHSVPSADPAAAGQVLQVVRPGFRTERSVLRYAEVTVGSPLTPAAGSKPAEDEAPGEGTQPAQPVLTSERLT
jgi:molecular chaperone GrpE (heat shock protein)